MSYTNVALRREKRIAWKDGRAAECGGLENRFTGTPGNEGSNPSPSARSCHDLIMNENLKARRLMKVSSPTTKVQFIARSFFIHHLVNVATTRSGKSSMSSSC